ncbi:MAG: hypothetical protein K9H64_23775 [Bacteroidales bacterium]|nr:hypothetical protein [Bacteroidales bacterium]MCF8457780.1 hypothetical protein [Bacteroidales bacterium]
MEVNSNSAFFIELFDQFPFAVIVSDENQHIIYVNQSYSKIFQTDLKIDKELSCYDIFACMKPSPAKYGDELIKCKNCIFKVSLNHALEKGSTTKRKQWIIQHNSSLEESIRLVEITVSPFTFQKKTYTITILEDISKNAEMSLNDGELLSDFVNKNR